MIELTLFGALIVVMIIVGVSGLYWRRGDRKNCPACQGVSGSLSGHPDERLCERHYQSAYRAWILAGDGD
jgi:hypothetical protein